MKLTCSLLLTLTLLLAFGAVPALAQDDEPPPLTEEQKQALQEKQREWMELTRQAQDAFQMKEYDKAVGFYTKAIAAVAGEKLLERSAASSSYNIACCYGLMSDKEKCLEWLEKSVSLGFRDANHMKMDTDLDVVKETDRFKSIVGGLLWNDEVTVIVPDGVEATTPLPVLLALHVELRDDKYVSEYLKAVANEAKVLLVAPRGPYAHPEGGYAWKLDPSEDGPALKKIGMALEAAARVHPFDPEKVTILGVGGRAGYMAYRLGLSEPQRYRRIVVLGGYFNKYLFPEYFEKAKPENKGVWILHGNELPQLDNAKAAEKLLTEAGFAVKFVEYEGKRRPKEDQLAPIKEALRW